MRYKEKIQFFAKDFYALLERQEYKCALSGRVLTPMNTEIELIEPNKDKDRAAMENHYAVDKSVSYLARHLSKNEIVILAREIASKHPKKPRKKL